MVTIYTKPSCTNCENTKRILKAAHVDFEVFDVMEDDEALAYVVNKNVRQMPYVETEDDAWSGMDKTKLGRLVAMNAKTATATSN